MSDSESEKINTLKEKRDGLDREERKMIRKERKNCTVPDLSKQPKDEKGYLEPTYRVPGGYMWSPQTGTVPTGIFDDDEIQFEAQDADTPMKQELAASDAEREKRK